MLSKSIIFINTFLLTMIFSAIHPNTLLFNVCQIKNPVWKPSANSGCFRWLPSIHPGLTRGMIGLVLFWPSH